MRSRPLVIFFAAGSLATLACAEENPVASELAEPAPETASLLPNSDTGLGTVRESFSEATEAHTIKPKPPAGSQLGPERAVDRVVRSEQQNWLAVGVLKLAGEYQPEAWLSATEREELAARRASHDSPTLFIDHAVQRLSATGSIAGDLGGEGAWQSAFADDWERSWQEWADRYAAPDPLVDLPRREENPYLAPVSANLPDDPAGSNWTLTPTADHEPSGFVEIVPAQPLAERQPSKLKSSETSLSPSQPSTPLILETSEPEPASSAPPRCEEPISEKYFRNLDRF